MRKWLKSIDCGILFRSAQVESDFFYALFFAALIIITNHTFLRSTWMQWPEVFRLVEVEEIHWKQFVSLTILHSCKFIYHEQHWFSQDCTACMCVRVRSCVCVCACLITKPQWLVHSLYGQKYWHPFFRREKGTSKLCQQRWKHNACT